MREYFLYFDESGNLGTAGRYFVISCIVTENPKTIYNTFRKTLLYFRTNKHGLKFNKYELKAKDCPRDIKKVMLSKISKDENLKLAYIVADKKQLDKKTLEDKNRFYNYLLKLILDNYSCAFKNNKVNLYLDNKTIKVNSLNSFEDYINIHFNLELRLNTEINIQYMDSSASNAYNIQVADYVANALYSYYEYDNKTYYDIIRCKRQVSLHFPYNSFGMDEISYFYDEVASTNCIDK